MATARCPCLGLGDGPVALPTFFHFRMGDAISRSVQFLTDAVVVTKLRRSDCFSLAMGAKFGEPSLIGCC